MVILFGQILIILNILSVSNRLFITDVGKQKFLYVSLV